MVLISDRKLCVVSSELNWCRGSGGVIDHVATEPTIYELNENLFPKSECVNFACVPRPKTVASPS